MSKEYYTYIMTNSRNTVLYTGITSNLMRRVGDHKAGIGGTFTKKYNVVKLVYYEFTNEAHLAITREKQIKSWSRKRKEDLINGINPEWKDLFDEFMV